MRGKETPLERDAYIRRRIFARSRFNPALCYAVYEELLSHNNIFQECFPSIPSISDALNVSVRNIHRCIDELERFGLIEIYRENRKANRYFFPNDLKYRCKGLALEAHRQREEVLRKITEYEDIPDNWKPYREARNETDIEIDSWGTG